MAILTMSTVNANTYDVISPERGAARTVTEYNDRLAAIYAERWAGIKALSEDYNARLKVIEDVWSAKLTELGVRPGEEGQ